MPKYRNDRTDEKTIFVGGKPIRYGEVEELDQYVYDPDLVLVSHVPHSARPLDPKLSKVDILIEDDLTIAAGAEKLAGPFNMQAMDFDAARSFGLLIEGGGPGNAELTVEVLAARADTSGEYWPFETSVVPISGEAPTSVYRTFDLEQVDAIVFRFSSAVNVSTITEAQLIV